MIIHSLLHFSHRKGAARTAGAVGVGLLISFSIGGLLLHDLYNGFIGDGLIHRMRAWQILWAAGFAGYLAALWAFRQSPPRAVSILAAAVLLRIPLLFTVPNTDVYRYMWEGRMQRLGFNPYLYAPNDAALASYRDDIHERINHRDVVAVYPPLTMLECRLMAAIAYHSRTPQIVHSLMDVAVIAAILALLRSTGAPSWYSAIYALNPLTLAAFAQGGHNDPLMILPLIAFVAAGMAGRWHWAGAALGTAVLAKTTPVILLAILARRSWRGALICLATIAAGYALFADAGFSTLRAIVGFSMNLSLNSPVDLAREAIHAVDGPRIVMSLRTQLTLVALAMVALYHLLRPRDFLTDTRRLLGIMLVCMPIIQFWYVTWPLALVALAPRFCSHWIVLTGTMVFWWEADLSGLMGRAWEPPDWATAAIWAPFFASLALEVWRRRSVGNTSVSSDSDKQSREGRNIVDVH